MIQPTPVPSPSSTTYGVSLGNFGTPFPAERVQDMVDLHMTRCRPLMGMDNIETAPGVYDWVSLDSLMAACGSKKINVDFALQHASAWHLLTQTCGGHALMDPQGALSFVQALCARYGDPQTGPLGAIESLNEGGDDSKTEHCRNPQSMVAILKVIYPWIKQHYPHILVGAGAQCEGKLAHITSWGNQFYALGGGEVCDYRSFHYYADHRAPWDDGGDPDQSDFETFWQTMAAVDKANNHPEIPIWCTETGWPTGAQGTVTPEVQSAYLQYVIQSVQHSGGKVAVLLVFTLAADDGFSLVTGQQHEVRLPAFRMWQQLTAPSPRTPVSL